MPSIIDQYEFNISKGPDFEPEAALPEYGVSQTKVRYIAYYLPQFHPIKENDRAWGSGFTEWTNVTKALPRYVGHYQPRLPADLGFYDLRSVNVLRRQMDLAKRGGIFGFCIHHYWFSGIEILDTPLKLILANSDIDIPFCLNWANESWSRRWDGSEREIIIEQRFEADDGQKFGESILGAVTDPRYIKVNGRPLIMIYRPGIIPNVRNAIGAFRDVFRRSGLPDPFIIMPQGLDAEDPRPYGLDGAAGFPPHKAIVGLVNERRRLRVLDHKFAGAVFSYDDVAANAQAIKPAEYSYFPGVFPNWDNEARRPRRSMSFYGSTPKKYARWLQAASRQAASAPLPDERIVFINAWNEWAEGAYLEPDRHFGFAYLAETRRCLDRLNQETEAATHAEGQATPPIRRFRTHPSVLNYPTNWRNDAVRKIRQQLGKAQ